MVKKMACPKCGGSGKVDDPRAIGEDMRKRREASGLSLREVARRIRTSAPYLCDLELGRRTGWTQDMIERVNAALTQ